MLGIPDFRLFPDPWIGLEDDRLKAARLEVIVKNLSFEQSVRAYWEITPTTPKPLAERYIQHVLESESRAGDWLDWLAGEELPSSPGCWLDVGCGTGDLLAAGASRNITVVGVDIALRWLIVAMRREALAGRTSQLVCANGEYLPFSSASVARVVSLGTLEHCRDAGRVISEARRTLVRGGLVRLRTVNRFTLLREPHVQVWGVGFVPRRWADRYVRLRSDQRYLHHKPLSPREISGALRKAGFVNVRVGAAALLDADRRRVRGVLTRMAPAYNRLRMLPGLRGLTRWISPLLDARGTAS
ncbi:MAG: methyltransferase domain-containing protein [Gemmatimonadaceae bacterium]